MKLFPRKHRHKPTTSVFVDYECWSFSLNQLYNLKPALKEFFDEIKDKYEVNRIYFFGDFSNGRLSSTLDDIRAFTNNIIDTRSSTGAPKKDFTDFIMLDYIYQDVDLNPKSEVYVIFSGDGHFSSAVSYLKNKKKKKIVVYGIRKATSHLLRNVADEVVELPTTRQESERYFKLILKNMDYLASQNRITYPTFKTTAQVVAKRNEIDERKITAALEELINMGVITQSIVNGGLGHQVNVLRTNWDEAERLGLWIRYDKAESV